MNNSKLGHLNTNVRNCNTHLSYRNHNSLTEAYKVSFITGSLNSISRLTYLQKHWLDKPEGSRWLNGWIVWTLQLPDFICLSEVVKRGESDEWKGMWRPGNSNENEPVEEHATPKRVYVKWNISDNTTAEVRLVKAEVFRLVFLQPLNPYNYFLHAFLLWISNTLSIGLKFFKQRSTSHTNNYHREYKVVVCNWVLKSVNVC